MTTITLKHACVLRVVRGSEIRTFKIKKNSTNTMFLIVTKLYYTTLAWLFKIWYSVPGLLQTYTQRARKRYGPRTFFWKRIFELSIIFRGYESKRKKRQKYCEKLEIFTPRRTMDHCNRDWKSFTYTIGVNKFKFS